MLPRDANLNRGVSAKECSVLFSIVQYSVPASIVVSSSIRSFQVQLSDSFKWCQSVIRNDIIETKYFKQEPIQRRFDFSDVLYFGWPNQPSSGTMRVYIELLLCTYIYIVNGC